MSIGDCKKKVLVVAFHFPPMTHSSGVQRTLQFVRLLPTHGWEPLVLTVRQSAFVATGPEQMRSIPKALHVRRAFALDAARHLSIAGRYPRFLATPDRWASWYPFGVMAGRRMISEHKPDVIFSTYPIATAHMIAHSLVRRSGLPWVADFRDPMYDQEYPVSAKERAANAKIENCVARSCSKGIVTARQAQRLYQSRYPSIPSDKWIVIPNGYDEQDFEALTPVRPSDSNNNGPRILLHSGVLYPIERDPLPFFRALRTLKTNGVVSASRLKVRLRATAHDDYFNGAVRELDIDDLVEILPPIPYAKALQEMMGVDGLLLFQGAGCNHQVPAKLYEYLRAQRPIIALTDDKGETAQILRESSSDNVLPLESEDGIISGLPTVLEKLETNGLKVAPMTSVQCYSRSTGAADLARLLNGLVS